MAASPKAKPAASAKPSKPAASKTPAAASAKPVVEDVKRRKPRRKMSEVQKEKIKMYKVLLQDAKPLEAKLLEGLLVAVKLNK